MIGTLTRFFGKLVRGSETAYGSQRSKPRFRRIAIEPLETRRLLAATGSISGFVYLDPSNAGKMTSASDGFAGMTVELLSVGSSGGTTLVSPGGIAATGSNGSYSFTGVAAGTYEVQISPSSRLVVGNLSPGSAGGTAGSNEIQFALAAGQAATDYNFAILGANPNYISARINLSTTGTLANYLSHSVLDPPALTSTGAAGASGTTYSTSYTVGASPVNVAPNATINSTESSDLMWLTATIENPVGSGDQLAADVPSDSGLNSNFANNVLTISGTAGAAEYQSALQSITYSTSSSPSGTGRPTIRIVASDGSTESAVYTTSIAVSPGSQAAPMVTTQPAAASVNLGGTASFTAAASGTPAPTVQWEVSTNGGSTFSAISGATSTTYSFTATAADTENEYEAVFTNSSGTATTSPALLKVDFVLTQPASQTINAGQSVSLSTASANGSTDTVQWQVSTDGGTTFTNISGATSTTYTFTATAAQNGDEYEAVFTNSAGSFTSNPATLTIAAAPAVTTQPTSEIADLGGTASFTAAASGAPAPTVQWQVSTDGGTTFTNIAGATSTTYSFAPSTAENGYEYQAVFTNMSGTVTSNPATLTVNSVTAQPASETVNTGQTASFTAGTFEPRRRGHRAVASEHRRRHDLHQYRRRHFHDLQLYGDRY